MSKPNPITRPWKAKDPSPAQIFAMCQAIQERWSDTEREKRAPSEKPVRWQLPGGKYIDGTDGTEADD